MKENTHSNAGGDIRLLNIIGSGIHPEDRIILDREKLIWVLNFFKKEGKKIVYTSGVYDLVHDGHVLYLEEAKKYGDILVVGVDSDALTRKRKPENDVRPIDKLDVRLKILVRNRSVDILTVRDTNEELEQLVKDIHPDVAIFSRSTKDTENFEAYIHERLDAHCGEIVFLEPQAPSSTTSKIRLVHLDGAADFATHLREDLEGHIDPEVLEGSIKKHLTKLKGE